MIKIEHLYKDYSKDIKVLKDISFTFEDGKTYAIIGSSGGGKSTLIRCLNMLEVPSEGTITLDGVVVNDPKTDLTRVREKMGMVFQNFNLFAHMDAKKNVAYALMKVKHMSKEDAYAISSPAVKNSVWQSQGHLRWNRKSCYAMSQPAPSTRK